MPLTDKELAAIYNPSNKILNSSHVAALRAVAEAVLADALKAEKLEAVTLVYGSPGDIELSSDGGGEYASTYKLNERGVKKISEALHL